MAGSYADPPSNRIEYGRDGTVAVGWRTDNMTRVSLTEADLNACNDESEGTSSLSAGGYGAGYCMALLFPTPRDIFGVSFGLKGNDGNNTLWWSTNTTSGMDGTWTQIVTPAIGEGNSYAVGSLLAYRDAVTGVTLMNCKGIKWMTDGYLGNNWSELRNLVLYGRPSVGATPEAVAIWHPTLDQRVDGAHFDWGNTPRGSTADRTFRVKNLSSTLTANGIVIATDALTDFSPSFPPQYMLSTDGLNFSSTKTITSLSPGSISAVYTYRRTTPTNAVLGAQRCRLKATVGSWS
jgi:hypothetical protein